MKSNGFGTYPSKIDSIVKKSAEEVDSSRNDHTVETSEAEPLPEAAD